MTDAWEIEEDLIDTHEDLIDQYAEFLEWASRQDPPIRAVKLG